MKKTIRNLGLILGMAFVSTNVQSQNSGSRLLDAYNLWAYNDVVGLSHEIETKGFNDASVLKRLGDAFFFNAKYAEANKQYKNLFKLYDADQIETIYLFRYAQTLKNEGEKNEALKYFDLYKKRLGEQSQFAKVNANFQEIEKSLENNSGRYTDIANLAINSKYSDYGSFVYDNVLYFTSNRDTGSFSKKIHTWTGNQFTNVYTAKTSSDNTETNRLSGISSKSMNESSAVITKDGKTMYFTSNNSRDGKRAYSEDMNTLLKIYKASLVDGKWTNIEVLPFNSDNFNTAHPALSADEKYMYFVSDRIGGYGASDLWKVQIKPDGTFGQPENLGPKVNTESRESFPFVSQKNELYFSTDGRIGFGGLDIYVGQIQDNGAVENIQNLGTPVNSSYDDFAYYINEQTQKGFFSSNRPGGKGSDDIYSFTQLRPIGFKCVQNVKLFVVDKATDEPIKEASVTLFDQTNKQVETTSSITNEYSFNHQFECGQTYKVAVNKDKYHIVETLIKLPAEAGVTEKTIALEAIPEPVKVVEPKVEKVEVKKGDDLYKVLKLKPIFFDYKKDDIRPDAALELSKVVKVMKDYPNMRIDVRSHTDSRGSDAYNLKLSDRRAKSTANWIVSNGIEKSRVTYRGYGETELINHCKNGVKCSDEEHEENRRSQFIIIEL